MQRIDEGRDQSVRSLRRGSSRLDASMTALPLSPRLVRAAVHNPLTRLLAGRPPRNDRGEQLDGQTHRMLSLQKRIGKPRLDEMGPSAARPYFVEEVRLVDVPPARLHRVEDRTIDSPRTAIRVRIYRPRARRDAQPALVYYHGGGFVVGDVDSHDGLCRRLALRSGLTVLSVDYALAPEHPFPGAYDDAVLAYRWVLEHADELVIDPARVAVGGDSAGGNLSAGVCLAMRDDDARSPAFQLLIYPATDMTRSMDSHRHLGEGYLLERETVDWFLANYLVRHEDQTDPRASPLSVADLAGLPPAHVVLAGFDPLRDEGEAYGLALMAAGVPTTMRCYGSLVHGFANMGGLIDAARHAIDDMAERLHAAV